MKFVIFICIRQRIYDGDHRVGGDGDDILGVVPAAVKQLYTFHPLVKAAQRCTPLYKRGEQRTDSTVQYPPNYELWLIVIKFAHNWLVALDIIHNKTQDRIRNHVESLQFYVVCIT